MTTKQTKWIVVLGINNIGEPCLDIHEMNKRASPEQYINAHYNNEVNYQVFEKKPTMRVI